MNEPKCQKHNEPMKMVDPVLIRYTCVKCNLEKFAKDQKPVPPEFEREFLANFNELLA